MGRLERVRVAVVGAGPTGLTMLKALREDGFSVTLYERRHNVGGLWAFSEDPVYTSALPVTRANLSKFTCGFSDFPLPDKYPNYMRPHEFQEYQQAFATHFDLLRDIVFGASVKQVRRNADDNGWLVDIEKDGKTETSGFDRIAICNGYQTKANIPIFEGQGLFTGQIIHSQAFKDPEPLRGKKVVVVGLSSTAGDIIPALMPVASRVYVSHRRGATPFKRYHKGTPADLAITWRRRQMSQILQRYTPNLARWVSDKAVGFMARRAWGKLDPAWRLEPFPSITLTLPGSFELVMPLLQDGSLTSLHGLTRFVGPKAVEFADGTVVDDVDAVVLCTGYSADFSITPQAVVETSKPPDAKYNGPPLPRLYLNLFPPAYADSCVLLSYCAFGKNNGFSFADITAWAVSSVWRGIEPLPARADMEKHIDAHQRWIASRRAIDPACDVSAVKQWEFQQWLHKAAGTGMAENLSLFTWKGWKFWWADRKLFNLMNHGVETAHAFRVFKTGRRKTWAGARDAIIHANEVVSKTFPMKEDEIPWPPRVSERVEAKVV